MWQLAVQEVVAPGRSYDWHSSVHGHWMLARLLRLFPDLPEAGEVRAVMGDHLTAENLKVEADYFARKESKSFERPYGWAWLLKLAEELNGWDDPDAKVWAKNLRPLADVVVDSVSGFLPQADVPDPNGRAPEHGVRAGVRPRLRPGGRRRAADRARRGAGRAYFGADADVPAGWEPGGADFFSPSLTEADLMRRVLLPGRVPRVVRQVPAGGGQGGAEGVVQARDRDRPDRPAVRPPGRAEPEPGVVHAERRGGPAGRRSGPSCADRVGSPPRRGGTRARGQRRLCGRALAGLVRRLPALDPAG